MTSDASAATGAATTQTAEAGPRLFRSPRGREAARRARRMSRVWVVGAVVLAVPPGTFVFMAAVLGAGMTGSAKAPLWVLVTMLVATLALALLCGVGVLVAIGLAYPLAAFARLRPVHAALVGAVLGAAGPLGALIGLNVLWS